MIGNHNAIVSCILPSNRCLLHSVLSLSLGGVFSHESDQITGHTSRVREFIGYDYDN